jgi:protein TonB
MAPPLAERRGSVPEPKPQVAAGAPKAAAPATPPVFNAGYLRNPAPEYPLLARRNGEQGTVTLKVLVARDGSPVSISVERTSGSERLDRAALDTVKTWRFIPAREGSEPVEAWVLVPIVFRLEGAS